MKQLKAKGKGKPDHSTDIAVSTVPVVIRHQTRFITSVLLKDVEVTLTSQSDEIISTLILKMEDAAGKTYFPMWLHGGISLYRRVRLWSAIIDLDKFIEAIYGIRPYKTKDIIVREFGGNEGFGAVELEYSVYSPIVIEYSENPERSTYLPQYPKYVWAEILTIYGTPGENLSFDVWLSATGMVSSYPWWK